MNDLEVVTAFAIFAAKQSGNQEVTPDHILLGCLRTISRFGVASLGSWNLDLEALGVDWLRQPDSQTPKVAYSEKSVELFDRAARISKADDETKVTVHHPVGGLRGRGYGLDGRAQAHARHYECFVEGGDRAHRSQ